MTLVTAPIPDMLAMTGDPIDEDVSDNTVLPLAGLDLPVFSCTRDHGRYAKYQKSLTSSRVVAPLFQVISTSLSTTLKFWGSRIDTCKSGPECIEFPAVINRLDLYVIHDISPSSGRPVSTAIHHGIYLMLTGGEEVMNLANFLNIAHRSEPDSAQFRSAISHLFRIGGHKSVRPIIAFRYTLRGDCS